MMMGFGGPLAPNYSGPVWQGEGSAASGAGAITRAWPAHQTDDIGFLFTVGASGTQTVASEGGWVHVTGSPVASGANVCINLLWKRATSGAMPNITTNDMGDHQAGFIFTVRGCIAAGDPWDTTSTNNGAGASVSQLIFTDIVTTVANTLILNLWGMSAVDNTPLSAWSNPDVANVVSRFDGATAAGNDSSWGYTSGECAATGTVTGAVATPNTNGYMASMVVALKAA